MRHRKKGRIFGRRRNQRKALLKQLGSSLVLHERIMTTQAKAKEVRPYIERVIAQARKGSLAGRRYAYRQLSSVAAKTLFSKRMERLGTRSSGWVRITKLAPRQSDGAKKALIEFV